MNDIKREHVLNIIRVNLTTQGSACLGGYFFISSMPQIFVAYTCMTRVFSIENGRNEKIISSFQMGITVLTFSVRLYVHPFVRLSPDKTDRHRGLKFGHGGQTEECLGQVHMSKVKVSRSKNVPNGYFNALSL